MFWPMRAGVVFQCSPSLRTLRDYKNYIRPRRGFNPDIINDLCEKTKECSPAETFKTILFDEIKIQEQVNIPGNRFG